MTSSYSHTSRLYFKIIWTIFFMFKHLLMVQDKRIEHIVLLVESVWDSVVLPVHPPRPRHQALCRFLWSSCGEPEPSGSSQSVNIQRRLLWCPLFRRKTQTFEWPQRLLPMCQWYKIINHICLYSPYSQITICLIGLSRTERDSFNITTTNITLS